MTCTLLRHIGDAVQNTVANAELSDVVGTGSDAARHMEVEKGGTEAEDGAYSKAESEKDNPAEGNLGLDWS